MTSRALKKSEVILGVAGGIAAYKTPDLARRFQDAGFSVTCVLTRSAEKFVSPLTLAAVSNRPAHRDIFDENSGGDMAHLMLAKKADAVVVAPCTAHFLSEAAAGNAGGLLTAILLVSRAPVFLVPAMHEPMWTHPATKRNVKICESLGYRFIGPARGVLASGDKGWGRMEDAPVIVDAVARGLKNYRS